MAGVLDGVSVEISDFVDRMLSPARDSWQKPDDVIDALGLKAGESICEIGAGPGYFTIRLAGAVGPEGHVFAVDVDATIVGVLRDRLGASGIQNVSPVLGLPDDPLLPDGLCDLVLVVNTMHDMPDPAACLRRLARILKPGGRIVNIDFHRRPSPMGPPMEIRIDRDVFVGHVLAAGLRVHAEHDFLPYHYFLELR